MMDLFSYRCIVLYVQLSTLNPTQMDANIDLWQFVFVKLTFRWKLFSNN